MHHREAVDQNGHVVTGSVFAFGRFILVEHLQTVIVDVALVDQVDVLVSTVVAPQDLDVVVLDLAGFLGDAFAGIGDLFHQKSAAILHP